MGKSLEIFNITALLFHLYVILITKLDSILSDVAHKCLKSLSFYVMC